jgi:hypothetical protein
MRIFKKIQMSRKLIIIISLMMTGLMAEADTNPVAHTGMFVDARAASMGGAYTAAAFGVEAAYYNPAGLTMFKGREFSSMLSTGLSFDRNFSFIGVAANPGFKNRMSAAVAWSNAGWGNMDGYDSNNMPDGDFEVKESSLMLSFAEYVDYLRLSWGTTIKMLNSDVDGSKAGFGLDIGLLHELGNFHMFEGVIVGAVVKDFYSKIDDEKLDAVYKIGVSGYYTPELFTVFDLGFGTGDNSKTTYALGLEYRYNISDLGPVQNMSFESADFLPRLGINTGDLYFGFGLNLPKFSLDYAFIPAPNSEFDTSHRFSLNIPF